MEDVIKGWNAFGKNVDQMGGYWEMVKANEGGKEERYYEWATRSSEGGTHTYAILFNYIDWDPKLNFCSIEVKSVQSTLGANDYYENYCNIYNAI